MRVVSSRPRFGVEFGCGNRGGFGDGFAGDRVRFGVEFGCGNRARFGGGFGCRALGSSLVEALIAMVIVAIGLVGVASLMIASLRNGHEALLRTQAVNLVSDMQERIRANPAGGGAYDCGTYPSGPSMRNCAASDVGAGVNCTARELAEDDLARWQSAVRMALPGTGAASGAAACEARVTYTAGLSSTEPARYLVSVSWSQRGASTPVTYESDLLLVSPTPSP